MAVRNPAQAVPNLSGGTANQIPYQTGVGATSFITTPTIASTYLQWTGSAFTWASASGGGTPGGANTQVQYNNSGSFGGISSLTYNGTTVSASNLTITGGSVNGSPVGNANASTGVFTTLSTGGGTSASSPGLTSTTSNFYITPLAPTGNNNAGTLTISAATAPGLGNGGSVVVNAGSSTSGAPGNISLTATNSNSVSNGGAINLTAGNGWSGGGGSQFGGNITLTAGTDGGGGGYGGNVTLVAGTTTGGVNGSIQLQGTTSVSGAFNSTLGSQFGTSFANYIQAGGASANSSPIVSAQGSDTNISLTLLSKNTGSIIFSTNTSSNIQFQINNKASAVNYIVAQGSATGPSASALTYINFTGSDTSVNAALITKGTGYVAISNGNSSDRQLLRVTSTNANNTGNLIQISGAAAGSSPSISAINQPSGTDSNVNIILTPKGSGTVQFGTYTAGTVVQAGYITITDSGGTTRRLLVG
jgi:hypothetical protein